MASSGKSRSSPRSPARALGGRAAFSLCLAGLAAGCNWLIGLQDVPPPPDAGPDATQPDGGADSASAADAPADATLDAAPDATPDVAVDGGVAEATPCTRDCLGGACVDGACQPVILVTADGGWSPASLAQDDSFLYWVDPYSGSIVRTDKGSGQSTVLDQDPLLPGPIAVDDAGLYWGNSTAVQHCLKSSCTPTASQVAQGVHAAIVSVAIDGNNVYWIEATGDHVLTAPKNGDNVPAASLWDTTDASAQQLATDGRRVYFTADDGLLRGVGVEGGAGFALGSLDAGGSYGIAVDGHDVYWTLGAGSAGAINATALSDLATVVAASGLPSPYGVASDGTNLFWIGSDGGASAGVYRCVIASCRPALLATASPYLAAVVVDDAAVYWADPGQANPAAGTVWKLAK